MLRLRWLAGYVMAQVLTLYLSDNQIVDLSWLTLTERLRRLREFRDRGRQQLQSLWALQASKASA